MTKPLRIKPNRDPESIVIGLSQALVWLMFVDFTPYLIDWLGDIQVGWPRVVGWTLISVAVIGLLWTNHMRASRFQGRGLMTILLAAMTLIYIRSNTTSPLAVLCSVSGLAIYLSALWGWFNIWVPGTEKQTPPPQVAATVWGYVAFWVFCVFEGLDHWPARVALAGAGTTIVLTYWLKQSHGHKPVLSLIQLGFLLPLIPFAQPTLLAAPAMIAALWWSRRIGNASDHPTHKGVDSWFDLVFADPARALITTFLVGALVGGVVLSLPASSEIGTAHGFLDSLFTATSAICVTGLAVLDTPAAFSTFGEVVIAVLIQLGGLGIMTFSTAALLALGRRISIRYELTATSLLNSPKHTDLKIMIRHVLLVTLTTESVGSLILTCLFRMHGEAWGSAAWRGIFTSISAFCNAGFSLQTDSLVPYHGDAAILITVASLIVLGGLGPFVVLNLVGRLRGERISMQSRLLLAAAGSLILLGMLAFCAFEWQNSLSGLPIVDRLTNAMFQSVTLRTAGFNSIDLSRITPATYAIMLPFMFVGGSPGSTAGGIKTTTLVVLVLLVRAAFQGRNQVAVQDFRIRPTTVFRAATVSVLGAIALGLIFIGLLLTQSMSMDVALFEAVSAFATVGLTIGGTNLLDETGKIIIMAAMFVGRIGPLTLLLALPSHTRGGAVHGLPETDLDIG